MNKASDNPKVRLLMESISRSIEGALGQHLFQNDREHTKKMITVALDAQWKEHGYTDVTYQFVDSGSDVIVKYYRNGKRQGVDYRDGKVRLFDVEGDDADTDDTCIRI